MDAAGACSSRSSNKNNDDIREAWKKTSGLIRDLAALLLRLGFGPWDSFSLRSPTTTLVVNRKSDTFLDLLLECLRRGIILERNLELDVSMRMDIWDAMDRPW